MRTTWNVSGKWINMLNNPTTSDPPISTYILCQKRIEISLILNLIRLIIPLAYIWVAFLQSRIHFWLRSIWANLEIGSEINWLNSNCQRARSGTCILTISKEIIVVLTRHIWDLVVHTGDNSIGSCLYMALKLPQTHTTHPTHFCKTVSLSVV